MDVWWRQLILAGAVALAVAGCSRGADQSSPEAVLESSRRFVEEGRADRLTDLILADSREMRRSLDALGTALGRLQELGQVVQEEFPDEVEEVTRAMRDRVESGEAGSMLGQLMTGARPSRRPSDRNNPGAAATRALKQLFADPYAWLREQSDRLSVTRLTDDQAAVLWDGKPVFGPLVGLTMRREDGHWYVALPIHIVEGAMGRKLGPEEWEIIADLFAVIDNSIRDTIDRIRSGRARSLEDVATIAGENMVLPIMFVGLAWSKMQDEMARSDGDDEEPAEPPRGG